MILGKIHRESYRKIRKRRNNHCPRSRRLERQRITKIEKWIKNEYKQILAAQYVDGTRKAKRLELYSGAQLAVIELQKDNS